MINCNGRKYTTFQEAVENGELEAKLGDLKVTRYVDYDYENEGDSTFLYSYDFYVELTDHLRELYKAFPEEYLAVVSKTDD